MSAHLFGITSRLFKYSHTVGRFELGGLGFFHPMDLALGKDGLVYTVSRSHNNTIISRARVRVSVVTLKEEHVMNFGSYGDGDGEFIWPIAVALDSQGNAYVSDEWLNRISIFSREGQFLEKWGVAGSKDSEVNRPSGLAFDKEDNLYMVDSANHRVQIFTKGGKFLSRFGSFGKEDGEMNMPWGITIDHKGDVYVADWRNDRIQKFTADGKFLATFGTTGTLVGQFNRPTGVAVDKDGDIYVADWANHRVQVFTSDFRYITHLIGDATPTKWGMDQLKANPPLYQQYLMANDSSTWRRFWYPVAVRVDDENRVVVVDCSRHRLQVYTKEYKVEGLSG